MATVLVNPAVLSDFELDLMSHDFRVWTVHTSATFPDAPQAAMQIRRALIDWSNGRWNVAADWTVVWITFGDSWLDGDNPIPWPAHAALWKKLAEYSENVRYNLGLGGMPETRSAARIPLTPGRALTGAGQRTPAGHTSAAPRWPARPRARCQRLPSAP